MKTVVIAKNDAGQRLDKFIAKAFPQLPQSLLYRSIRLKRIKRNGKRADIADRLCEGDRLDLYLNDELLAPAKERYDFLRASRKLDVVYEDENILLLNKPEGLLCHADGETYGDTLIGRVARYLYEKGEYDPKKEQSFAPALANRIDRNTGGMVIAAKNAEALRILNQKIKDRELSKGYLCLVHGLPEPREATLEGYLWKDAKQNRVYVYPQPRPGAKTIVTRYRVLGTRDGLSLLDVDLLTGRTHQIRAHLAFLGYPLVGDGKYGKNAADRKKGFLHQALYSYRLKFEFTTDAGVLGYLNGREFVVRDIWFAHGFSVGGRQHRSLS